MNYEIYFDAGQCRTTPFTPPPLYIPSIYIYKPSLTRGGRYDRRSKHTVFLQHDRCHGNPVSPSWQRLRKVRSREKEE